MGPFGKEGITYKHVKGKWIGRLLVEENGYKIMQALAQCSVLSVAQAVALSGCGKNSRDVLPRLVEKGYLDCYESQQAPKLYSLGEKGAELMGMNYRTWDTGGLLRLAAANQFWLQWLKMEWLGSKWDTSGEFPLLKNGEVKFAVLAPRRGHIDQLLVLRQLNKCQDRVFIVAPDEICAIGIALSCPPGRLIRYTWDDELREQLTLYQLEGKRFVVDTAFRSPEENFSKAAQSC